MMKSPSTSRSPIRRQRKSYWRASWPVALTELFIRLCAEEVKAGNMLTRTLNDVGWKNLEHKFNKTSGYVYVYEKFKRKWDRLRSDWKLWMKLKWEAKGLGWDAKNETFEADESWWNHIIKKYPRAEKFRARGPLLQNLQGFIFCGYPPLSGLVLSPDQSLPLQHGGNNCNGNRARSSSPESVGETSPERGLSPPHFRRLVGPKALEMRHKHGEPKEGLKCGDRNKCVLNGREMEQPKKNPTDTAIEILNNMKEIRDNIGLYAFSLSQLLNPSVAEIWIRLRTDAARRGWLVFSFENCKLEGMGREFKDSRFDGHCGSSDQGYGRSTDIESGGHQRSETNKNANSQQTKAAIDILINMDAMVHGDKLFSFGVTQLMKPTYALVWNHFQTNGERRAWLDYMYECFARETEHGRGYRGGSGGVRSGSSYPGAGNGSSRTDVGRVIGVHTANGKPAERSGGSGYGGVGGVGKYDGAIWHARNGISNAGGYHLTRC